LKRRRSESTRTRQRNETVHGSGQDQAALERMEHLACEAAALRARLTPARLDWLQRIVRSGLVGLIVLCGIAIIWLFWAPGF
jgi:hypothetical protein